MRPSTTPRGRGELLQRTHRRGRAVDLVALELGYLLGVVHVAEVGGVDPVLGEVLPRCLDPVDGGLDLGVVLGVVEFRNDRHIPHRVDALGVVPGHDEAVALHDGIDVEPALGVGALAVGDEGVRALGVELPPVERTGDLTSGDLASVAQVSSEVGAERALEVGCPLVVAPQHLVSAEVHERLGRTGLEIGRPGDLEPAEGNGKG